MLADACTDRAKIDPSKQVLLPSLHHTVLALHRRLTLGHGSQVFGNLGDCCRCCLVQKLAVREEANVSVV